MKDLTLELTGPNGSIKTTVLIHGLSAAIRSMYVHEAQTYQVLVLSTERDRAKLLSELLETELLRNSTVVDHAYSTYQAFLELGSEPHLSTNFLICDKFNQLLPSVHVSLQSRLLSMTKLKQIINFGVSK